jgi:plastocyanin
VIDVSNPLSPQILGSVDTPGNAMDVAISGSLAFVTNDDVTAGFQVIDLSNPHSPSILGTLAMPEAANGIAVTGSVAYVADGSFDVQVVDISNPSSPRIIGRGPEAGNIARKVAASNQFACMTNTGPGANILLILPPQCFNAFPVLQNPGTQNGSELKYFSTTLNATDAEGDPLTMSVVGSLPAWATFSDVGNGTALLRGTPQSGQAGTYPVSIRASDGHGMATVSFNIVIASAQVVVNLTSSGFIPGPVTVPRGGQITWVKIASGNHTTTNGTGPLDPAAGTLWDAQLRSTSPQYVRVFATGGTFPYFCRNHPTETGTITVSAAQTGVDGNGSPRFRLIASPNPFRSGVDLQFDLERAEQASVTVMDLQGRKVRNLVAGEFPAGTHRVFWEGRDDNRALVGPGLYFARLVTGNGVVKVQKLFKIR